MAPFERVTVISRSAKTTPVKLSRCRRTQQLSAPVTETKRCVTIQFVVGDETAGEGACGRRRRGCGWHRRRGSAAARSEEQRGRKQNVAHCVSALMFVLRLTHRNLSGTQHGVSTKLLRRRGNERKPIGLLCGFVDRECVSFLLSELPDSTHAFFDQCELISVYAHHQAMAFIA